MGGRRLARADLATGAVLVLAAAWIVVEAVTMPRFEARGINPWTVPGIMPGMVGAVLVVLGLALVARALRRLRRAGASVPGDDGLRHGGAAGDLAEAAKGPALGDDRQRAEAAPAAGPPMVTDPDRSRPTGAVAVALAGLIAGVYVLLIGRLPFAWLTFAFLVTFMVAFEWRRLAATDRARRLAMIVFASALVAILVPLLFERVFLVRLP